MNDIKKKILGRDEYKNTEKALDVASTIGLGSLGGVAAGSSIGKYVHGAVGDIPRQAYSGEELLKKTQKGILRKTKTYRHGVLGGLAGAGVGALYGAYRINKKEGRPLPDYVQVPGILALAGASASAVRNKGKVISSVTGDIGKMDIFMNDADNVFGKEEWISKKRFKEMPSGKVNINDELKEQLAQKYKIIHDSPPVKPLNPGEGRGIDEIWDEMSRSNSKYIKPVGGDPEAKVYMRIGGERLPINVNSNYMYKGFKNGTETKNYVTKKNGIPYKIVSDNSVDGLEIEAAPMGDPKAFFSNINEITDDIKKRMGGMYDLSTPALGPAVGSKGSNLIQSDLKQGGGHIQMQFPTDETIKYVTIDGVKYERNNPAMRSTLAKRSFFASIPFDYTHPAMPHRSGLFPKNEYSNLENYGTEILPQRSLNPTNSWKPDRGYISFEHRTSPSYMGDSADLSAKKVKLMQIINSDKEISKDVDNLMNRVMKISKNDPSALYEPNIRNMVSDEYQSIMNKAKIKDETIEDLITKYRSGELRKHAEEEKREAPSKYRKMYLPLSLGAAAGIGGYLYSRRRTGAGRLQDLANESITLVRGDKPSKMDRAMYKLLYGPNLNYASRDELGNAFEGKVKGVVYNSYWNPRKVKGDITINPGSVVGADDLIDLKSGQDTLPGIGKYFIKSHSIKDNLEKMGISKKQFMEMADDDAERLILKIEAQTVGQGKGFMKPLEGQSMGSSSDDLYAPVNKIRYYKIVKPKAPVEPLIYGSAPRLKRHHQGLSTIKRDLEQYIIQENVNPLKKEKEVRMHVLNGEIVDTVRRFGSNEGAPVSFFKNPQEKKQMEMDIKEFLSKSKETKGIMGNPDEGIAFAFDAVRDTTGAPRIIEGNSSSGFVWPPGMLSQNFYDNYSGHNMYKKLTGRNSRGVSLMRGVQYGSAAAGGSVLAQKVRERSMDKKAADDKDNRSKVAPWAIGAAGAALAGLGAYKYLRKYPSHPTEMQEAAKKGFTIVSTDGITPKQKRIYKALISGDVNYDKIQRYPDSNQVYKGLVYHKDWVNRRGKTVSRVSGDVTVNPPSMHTIGTPLVDKMEYENLPGIGKYFFKTRILSDALVEHGISPEDFMKMNDDQAENVIKQIETKLFGQGGGFIKSRHGEMMGKGTDELYGPIQTIRKMRLTKPQSLKESLKKESKPYLAPHDYGLSGIRGNPDDYILQKNMNTRGAVKETRIHTINGDVHDTVTRFGALEGVPEKYFKTPQEKKEFENSLKELYKSHPTAKDYSGKRALAVSFDATRDESGAMRLLEANINSGFTFDPDLVSGSPFEYLSSHSMYKSMTGRDTRMMAGLKSIPVAAGIGAAGVAATNQYNKKHAEEKDEAKKRRNKSLRIGLASGAIAAGGVYLARNKPWVKGKLYTITEGKTQGKSFRSIVNIDPDDIKSLKMTKYDRAYNELDNAYYGAQNSPIKSLGDSPRNINVSEGLTLLGDKAKSYETLPEYSKHLPKLYGRASDDDLSIVRSVLEEEGTDRAMEALSEMVAKRNGLSSGTKFFFKEKMGEGSRGTYLSTDPSVYKKNTRKGLSSKIYDVMANKKRPSPESQLRTYLGNPDMHILQEQLPKGREYRVATHNGKVVGIIDRHGVDNILLPNSGISKEKMYAIKDLTAKAERDLRKDIKITGDTYLGHDIIIPADSKIGPRLVETNTQDGYYSYFPNALYSSLYNKDTNTVAAAKGTAIGILAGTASGSGYNMYSRKKMNRNKESK